ncbi:SDR family oxidoreductase [Collimonas pratensis]|uniref:Short chain dehydrogenase family protein n=1 Tax=Collimonas pratensis TaxID=279113 RepID=A0ABM5ZAX3_9BURK|nr:SDR family oxidoreductase [Collimonas pratensis]AMP16195.1 short chain dehydrogenase family protein [Collimonas pratensis]NKI70534.1 NAD-dependent epimerase/dehydratase family protein [Collimonas pratensis]
MNNLILMTGATGFLGGANAVEAIHRGLGKNLLLLARADTPAAAHARVIKNLQLLGASAADIAQIGVEQILCSDLSELDNVAGDPRLDQVSVVVHSAALATFSNHPSLEKINVDGTLALGKLMHQRPALKRFMYIGTAMACGEGAGINAVVKENIDLPLGDEHLVAYTRSKAMGEKKLRDTYPDLPVIYVRPSIIVGHTVLGCAPSQSIFWVFMVWQLLGALTTALDEKVDVVPVDWCAQAIIDLAQKETLTHNVFHISAGQGSSVSFREIDLALAAARGIEPIGATYKQITPDAIATLLPRMRECVPECNDRLLLRALKLYGAFAGLNYVFDNSNLLAEGIRPAPLFTDYVALCVESAKHIPIAEQMKWDFK